MPFLRSSVVFFRILRMLTKAKFFQHRLHYNERGRTRRLYCR